MQLSRPHWRLAALTTSLVAGLAFTPTAPAAAHPPQPQDERIVASGLNNPRHVRWTKGALYVAEAGVGGSGACVASPEGGNACLGPSGSITRVTPRGQRRVVTGLPSLAVQEGGGASATGPSDVSVHGRKFTVAIGLGANPALRPTGALASRLATVSTGRLGRPGLRVVADLGAYEAATNPDGNPADDGIDTNPVALLQRGRSTYAVDAGGNDLLRIGRHGGIRTTAVFPAADVPAPPFLGLPPGATIPSQAVPTAAAYGPDGALYVSQLTGFPFPVGGASIWRVVPGHAPTAYATGLTNVTDLAFGRGGVLYAVQIADQGLLAPEATGSVVRIPAGGGAEHTTVKDGLTSPYGIALHGSSAYVTTCSTCAGGGEVLRIPLRPAS